MRILYTPIHPSPQLDFSKKHREVSNLPHPQPSHWPRAGTVPAPPAISSSKKMWPAKIWYHTVDGCKILHLGWLKHDKHVETLKKIGINHIPSQLWFKPCDSIVSTEGGNVQRCQATVVQPVPQWGECIKWNACHMFDQIWTFNDFYNVYICMCFTIPKRSTQYMWYPQ